jgi:hypothetical protein
VTIVIHLRNGGRLVRQGEPTPRICIPVFEGAPAHPYESWRFGRELYRLIDVREIAGQEVACYVYDPTPEPEITYSDVPPGRMTWRDRLADWCESIWHRISGRRPC